jgi:ABC-type phosphate transport system substrate-binding protein
MPGKLPSGCGTGQAAVEGMYAGVGSGNGFRGYISNDPSQWYGGTINPSTTTNTTIAPPFPAAQPPYVDSSNSTNFGTYPYPRVDAGMSDSPLSFAGTSTTLTTVAISFNPATNWTTAGVSATQVTVNSTTSVATYNGASWGAPVQLPLFEVPVAIPMNVNSTSLQINSQIKSGGAIVPGGAIQLTEGQLCAIFSGLVTNWNDSSTVIPILTNAATATSTATFSYANIGNGQGTAQPYANASLPITVTFRSDGSGTSFILTNYLSTVCPLLDPNDTYKYQSIFVNGAKHLPSTSFADLITDVQNARGTTVAANWVGASGSGGVQAAIGTASAQAGFIGYVSADFTKPYAVAANAPYAASLQNENQRISGVNTPSATATTLTFIAPSPTSANNAWSDSALTPPSPTSTWAAWNVYGITYSSTEPAHGNVAVAGKSVLPLTNHIGAYPLSGTTFMALYSCYGNDNNGGNVINFLNWFYQNNGTTDSDIPSVLNNNGFSPLNVVWQGAIQQGYLNPVSSVAISTIDGIGGGGGCTNVTGGANP